MPRYIDAEKIEWHEQLEPLGNGKYEYCRVAYMDDIDDIPTADVRENVHGNWVGIDDEPCETFECDRCGFVLEDWILGAFYTFCPNCGADMRGEEDD